MRKSLKNSVFTADKTNTDVKARVIDAYEFGMHGSNIGKIDGNTITLVEGKVRQFFVQDTADKDTANQANKTEYMGTLGRVPSLRPCDEIITQLESVNGTAQSYKIISASGVEKTYDNPVTGDKLIVTAENGQDTGEYEIEVTTAAMAGKLLFPRDTITANVTHDLVIEYYAGQRTPEAEVHFYLPAGIHATMENTMVNLIGRGNVLLSRFGESRGRQLYDGTASFENKDAHNLLGRFAADYQYQTLGTVEIINNDDGTQVIRFKGVDLRPNNGADFILTIKDINLSKAGCYQFSADYKTLDKAIAPLSPALQSLGGGTDVAWLTVVTTVSDFVRKIDKSISYKEPDYTMADFTWSAAAMASGIEIWQNEGTVTEAAKVTPGTVWTRANITIAPGASEATVTGLKPYRFYQFKLVVTGGTNEGDSNTAGFYSGKLDSCLFGVTSGAAFDTARTNGAAINTAIGWLNSIGGGTLLFTGGETYYTATVFLQSNVCLYLDGKTTVAAWDGAMDDPESAWWHYADYSDVDEGSFDNPDNFLSKQDDAHSYFRNAMFVARRADNAKIIGSGRFDGNGALRKDNFQVKNAGGSRADTMIALKLCTNFELGGIRKDGKDLKMDTAKTYDDNIDRPFYEDENGVRDTDLSNMLYADRGGHFLLLSAGTDHINVHDIYYGCNTLENTRDVFDFMENNDVHLTDIFARRFGDDIAKLGSDCALGFTRPVRGAYLRNIISSTGCHNFQIGSETADDIQDVYVDNLTVLASNKCAFSVSTNDGAYVKNIYMNSGKTGRIFGQSHWERAKTPIFISTSNRGRVMGAKLTFHPDRWGNLSGTVQNVPIGTIDGVTIKDVEIVNAFGGNGPGIQTYETQTEFTSVIVGYQMPAGTPSMCDGRFTGYVKNVTIDNVSQTVKGYGNYTVNTGVQGQLYGDIVINGNHKFDETRLIVNELNMGQWNSINMGVRPAYGFYVRHAENFVIRNSKLDFERNDDRYPIVFDDVTGAAIENVIMSKGTGVDAHIQTRNNTSGIIIKDCQCLVVSYS